MKFIETPAREAGIQALSTRLSDELKQGKRLVWLVCGGSNIPAIVKVSQSLAPELTEKLTIGLTDERYDDADHRHSNARQLHEAGLQPHNAIFLPILEPGFSMAETQERYATALQAAIEHADTIVALFGIGADGHIAGLLPHSPAVSASGWTTSYETPPYSRVTITFEAVRHIDAAYCLVFGEEKAAALKRLRDEAVDPTEQPAQILKELPELYIYNDQLNNK